MRNILLLQFRNDPDCAARRELLAQADLDVAEAEPRWPVFFGAVNARRPDAIVIACSRLPSHAFECARYLGDGFNTRDIPVLLVDVLDKDLMRARSSANRARMVARDEVEPAVRDVLSSSPAGRARPQAQRTAGEG